MQGRLRHEEHGIRLGRRKRGEIKRGQEPCEPLRGHRVADGAAVTREHAKLLARKVVVVGRHVRTRLVEGVPPQKVAAIRRPEVLELRTAKVL